MTTLPNILKAYLHKFCVMIQDVLERQQNCWTIVYLLAMLSDLACCCFSLLWIFELKRGQKQNIINIAQK